MASRRRTLTDAIVSKVNAWPGKPANVDVRRVRNVFTVLQDVLAQAAPATICVINSAVEDESGRGGVADNVRIGVVLVAACSSNAVADSDSWDDTMEALFDYMRTDAAGFKNITVGSLGAQRREISQPIVCDAETMDENEAFVSVIDSVYFISVSNR